MSTVVTDTTESYKVVRRNTNIEADAAGLYETDTVMSQAFLDTAVYLMFY